MSHLPVITVVIPTYNHAHFLGDALDSLCAQTYTKWEAIVVNNFSDDNTIVVVESYKDPRIILENFSNNGVIAASRNRGIVLSRGKYIAFLDSDDTWYPTKLARCMEQFAEDIDLVCHGLRWFGDQKRDVLCGPRQAATFDALVYKGCSITTSAAVVLKERLEVAGCFSENLEIVTAEDYHLWIKLAQAGAKMHFIMEILGGYRVHSCNQSGSVLRHMNAILYVVEQFIPDKSSWGFKTRIRVNWRYSIAYYGAGRLMQNNKQHAKALPLLFHAILYSPFFIKGYYAIFLGLVGMVRQWRR